MRNSNRAFTLIELLTVIAIIAILSAIILPVYASAKRSAQKGADASDMNSIRTALQLYRQDQGGFPPALLGYVTLYQNNNNVVPANKAAGFLYPKRVDGLESLRPELNQIQGNQLLATTRAVWPNADPRPTPQAPQVDLNGDGRIDSNDDLPNARQRYTNNEVVTQNPNNPASAPQEFYRISGYDVAEVRTPNGRRTELRYTLFWTIWGLSGGNAFDDPRQLGYSDPDDRTIITWNSFFRDYQNNGQVDTGITEQVLYLGGALVNRGARDMAERSYRVSPPIR